MKKASGKSFEGWYIASVIEHFEWADPRDRSLIPQSPVWENYHLIRAGSPVEAYRKAVALYANARDSSIMAGKKGRWVFLGVSELLPVYEPLEDGGEIMWTDHGKLLRSEAEEMTRSEEEATAAYDDGAA